MNRSSFKYFLLIFSFFGCQQVLGPNWGEVEPMDCHLWGNYAVLNGQSYYEWTYYSFSEDTVAVVEFNDNIHPEESLDWDIAVLRNHFRTNSGLSGMGSGGVYMIDNSTLEDSPTIWSCDLFNQFNDKIDTNLFVPDGMLNNIYDPLNHDNPDLVYSDAPGSEVLENWGWFDLDNNYYFNYTHKQFFIRLHDERQLKVWPYYYYNDVGNSGFITVQYDFLED